MTKQREIEILKNTIQALGTESYMGPWLEQNLPYIEADIRGDVLPMTIEQSTKHARQIQKEAEAYAKNVRENADIEAGRIMASARKLRYDTLETAKNMLRRLANNL